MCDHTNVLVGEQHKPCAGPCCSVPGIDHRRRKTGADRRPRSLPLLCTVPAECRALPAHTTKTLLHCPAGLFALSRCLLGDRQPRTGPTLVFEATARKLDTASPKGYRVSTLFPHRQPQPPACLFVCCICTCRYERSACDFARDPQQEAVSWDNRRFEADWSGARA
jgi:hypothetical protein